MKEAQNLHHKNKKQDPPRKKAAEQKHTTILVTKIKMEKKEVNSSVGAKTPRTSMNMKKIKMINKPRRRKKRKRRAVERTSEKSSMMTKMCPEAEEEELEDHLPLASGEEVVVASEEALLDLEIWTEITWGQWELQNI